MSAQIMLQQALQYHQSGQLGQAENLYRQVLQQQPQNADALNLLGLLAHQAGHSEAGEQLIRQAIELNPKAFGYHNNLATVLNELKQYEAAIEHCRKAIRLQPKVAEAHNNLGVALLRQAQFPEAEKAFRKALKLNRHYPEACNNLGLVFEAQAQFEQAEQQYRKALTLNTDYIDTKVNLAGNLYQQSRMNEAAALYQSVLKQQPDNTEALHGWGTLLILSGHGQAAFECYQHCLTLNPEDSTALNGAGAALQEMNRSSESLAYYQRSLAVNPFNVETYCDYGKALYELNHLKESIDILKQGVQLLSTPGGVFNRTNKFAIHANLAISRLLAGDFDIQTWTDWEWRIGKREPQDYIIDLRDPAQSAIAARPSTLLPMDWSNKRVLLVKDQGLGDELFFLRFAGQFKKTGVWLAYHPNQKISTLVKRMTALDCIIDDPLLVPDMNIDHVISVGDLPLLTGMSGFSDIPPPLPLGIQPDALAAIQQQLQQLSLQDKPLIGVTWRAGTGGFFGHQRKMFKQINPEQLAEILKPLDCHVLNLQREPEASETAAFAEALGRPVHDFSHLNDNLEQMLALLSLLDDYVGVSNTNMHLRAAVGKTARVLAICNLDWRWMAEGSSSPWYPGFHVYRQTPQRDWTIALNELRRDLSPAD